LIWFRLAKALGTSVAEAQQRIGSSEFVEWKVFLADEPNHFNPLWYYLAQIAKEVRQAAMFNKRSYKVKDFLIEFAGRTAPQKAEIERSKKAWMTFAHSKK
jgi:hypothetical protein